MAPARPLKRQKTNEATPTEAPKPSQIPLPPDTPITPEPPRVAQASDGSSSPWYKSWPRKAAPITQIARESASIASDAASEVSSIIRDKTTDRRSLARNPSLAMTLGKAGSNRSLPVNATTTNVYAMPEAASPSRKNSSQPDLKKAANRPEQPVENGKAPEKDAQPKQNVEQKADAPKPIETTPGGPAIPDTVLEQPGKIKITNRSSWLPWGGRADEVNSDATDKKTDKKPNNLSKPIAETTPATSSIPATSQPVQEPSKSTTTETSEAPASNNKRSWSQMWTGSATIENDAKSAATTIKDVSKADPVAKTKTLEVPHPGTPVKSSNVSQASSIETSPPPPLPGDSTKSSGWVFWSRDRRNNASISTSEEQPHVGEIAISDTPSQVKPKRASISVPKDEGSKVEPPLAKQKEIPKTVPMTNTEALKQLSSERPKTPPAEAKGHAKKDSKVTKLDSPLATARAQEPTDASSIRTSSPTPSARRKYAENLLLPSFTETLSMQENPSILQQLARLLYYTKEPEMKHLSLVKDPPRIHNALAIGVHGYFPGPMVRTLIGQPTGTSIKFADMAAKSIKNWTRGRGYDCQVKTAALEGEGKIAERVELLWKLLLNWIDEIRKSDFVMVACHSQGVPVAVMLVAKLIQFGCITSARVGICAMAGVSMGPFAELKSRWISGSAGELFEFSDPTSKVSDGYLSALDVVLKAGVRLTYIGSIDDQLVSLESSIFAPVTHPHIYRAVSIDGRIHAPNFLSHLVGFVLKLRNLGVQDHGLIRELSSPLAGSLYTGEGHSRIYDDDAVYDLAVSFALETTSLHGVELHKRYISPSGGNPYILPFAMRGILEEDRVKQGLQEEAQQLLREFDDWRPNTKVLKDVKFRLEGVRSKL